MYVRPEKSLVKLPFSLQFNGVLWKGDGFFLEKDFRTVQEELALFCSKEADHTVLFWYIELSEEFMEWNTVERAINREIDTRTE